jgi:hypothetical protein
METFFKGLHFFTSVLIGAVLQVRQSRGHHRHPSEDYVKDIIYSDRLLISSAERKRL